MKPAQLTTDEALRVVGHLLEHHPTTRAAARDGRGHAVSVFDGEATCYCLTGAISLVARTFRLGVDGLGLSAAELLIGPLTQAMVLSLSGRLAKHWDLLGPAWRREAVEKLKRAGLPATEAL